jgi:hypothetical protein
MFFQILLKQKRSRQPWLAASGWVGTFYLFPNPLIQCGFF